MASLDYEGKFGKIKELVTSMKRYIVLLSDNEKGAYNGLDKLTLKEYRENSAIPDHFYDILNTAKTNIIPRNQISSEKLPEDQLSKTLLVLKRNIGILRQGTYKEFLTKEEKGILEFLLPLKFAEYKESPDAYNHYFERINSAIKEIIPFQKQKERFEKMKMNFRLLYDIPEYREKIMNLGRLFRDHNRGDVSKIITDLNEINYAIENMMRENNVDSARQVVERIMGLAPAAASSSSSSGISMSGLNSSFKQVAAKPASASSSGMSIPLLKEPPTFKQEAAKPASASSSKKEKYLKYGNSEAVSPSSYIWHAKYIKYKVKYLQLKSLII